MSFHDDEPELAGYEPHEGRPLRKRRTIIIMRVVVVLGLVSLVVPGVLTTIRVSDQTAQASCAIWVAYEEPGSPGSIARFEVFGPSGLGWECYTVGAFGGDRHIASIGLIPGAPRLPNPAQVDS